MDCGNYRSIFARNSKQWLFAPLFVVLACVAAAFAPPEAWGAPGAADCEQLTWLKSGDFKALEGYFSGLQQSYEAGQIPDEKLYQGFRTLYQDDVANAYYFDEWVEAQPNSYAAHVARGTYYYRMAWSARGEAFIQDTKPEQIYAMRSYLAKAREDLMDSFKMTAKPYLSTLYMLNVDMLDGSADRRRHWLDLGTSIDPDNKLLRRRYLFSLQPKWGGSFEEMRAFIDECIKEKVSESMVAEFRLTVAYDVAESMPLNKTSSERLDRWNDVIALARAAEQPSPPTALAGIARSAYELGRRDDADRALAKLAKLDINEAWVLSTMGYIYAREGRMAEAWPVIKKAADLNDGWSQFTVGQTLLQGCPEIHLAVDRQAGMAWIRRSARQGFPEAVAFLAPKGNPLSLQYAPVRNGLLLMLAVLLGMAAIVMRRRPGTPASGASGGSDLTLGTATSLGDAAQASASSLTVSLRSQKIIGVVCATFFLACAIGAYSSRQYGPIAIFVFFILMGLYSIASSGEIQVNTLNISQRTSFGLFRMAWGDVNRVEVGGHGTLVLHGADQRFVLAPASMWSGKDKSQAIELIGRKLQQRCIIPSLSRLADYKIHKNVRVASAATTKSSFQ
jgi:tetratricopeptide (TPR) repeat protein